MHETTQHGLSAAETGDERQRRDAALWQRVGESPFVGPGPHIWVGTVDDYLAGVPHGRWIDVARTVENVERDVATLAARSPAAVRSGGHRIAWHVFSVHGFGRYMPASNAPLYEMVRRAHQYREDVRAYRSWARLNGDERVRLERFYDVYRGRYERFEDWVVLEVERAGYDRLLDQTVPYAIRPHVEINIESLAYELRETKAVFVTNDVEAGGVFVFHNAQASLS